MKRMGDNNVVGKYVYEKPKTSQNILALKKEESKSKTEVGINIKLIMLIHFFNFFNIEIDKNLFHVPLCD